MKLAARLLVGVMLACGTLHAIAQPAAPTYSVEDFLKRDRFKQVRISPKGTYVAATVPLEDRTVLVILKPGQTTPYGYVNFKETNTHVADFWWVNDERVLFTVGERAGALEEPVSFGEIWGTNADGTRQGILVGARASNSASRAGGKSKSERSSFFIIDTLRDEEDFVLVGTYPFEAGEAPYTSVERMNVNSGTKTVVVRAPVRGSGFLTDHQGVVRFAAGENRDYKSVLYYRPDGRAPWQLINDESKSGKVIAPHAFDQSGRIAYLQSTEKTGPDSVQAFDTATLQMREVARDAFVDPAGLVYGIANRNPIGVLFLDGKPRYQYFDPQSADARMHRSLQSSFGGDAVTTTSFTDDGKTALLVAWSDRNPGDYYAFDTASKKADLMFSRADWFDPARMAQTRPVRFKARDGRQVEAFLTVPSGSSGKDLPMVVHPHGGPFGVSDAWGFGSEAQLLASQGYAVLQVNFRGSGGYGKEFERAGYKQWGKAMQDDVTDATRWAIQQGVADASRICIYGASYGAYASLMGVAKEPDLYRCAVGYVGVYDLKMLWGRGDIAGSLHGRSFLEETVGKDDLASASVTTLAGRIRVPVMLAAGGEDVRTPIEQTQAMERALRAAAVPVETLYYPTEGHGFHKLEHRREFYTRLTAFLARHLRAGTGRAGGLQPAGTD